VAWRIEKCFVWMKNIYSRGRVTLKSAAIQIGDVVRTSCLPYGATSFYRVGFGFGFEQGF